MSSLCQQIDKLSSFKLKANSQVSTHTPSTCQTTCIFIINSLSQLIGRESSSLRPADDYWIPLMLFMCTIPYYWCWTVTDTQKGMEVIKDYVKHQNTSQLALYKVTVGLMQSLIKTFKTLDWNTELTSWIYSRETSFTHDRENFEGIMKDWDTGFTRVQGTDEHMTLIFFN